MIMRSASRVERAERAQQQLAAVVVEVGQLRHARGGRHERARSAGPFTTISSIVFWPVEHVLQVEARVQAEQQVEVRLREVAVHQQRRARRARRARPRGSRRGCSCRRRPCRWSTTIVRARGRLHCAGCSRRRRRGAAADAARAAHGRPRRACGAGSRAVPGRERADRGDERPEAQLVVAARERQSRSRGARAGAARRGATRPRRSRRRAGRRSGGASRRRVVGAGERGERAHAALRWARTPVPRAGIRSVVAYASPTSRTVMRSAPAASSTVRRSSEQQRQHQALALLERVDLGAHAARSGRRRVVAVRRALHAAFRSGGRRRPSTSSSARRTARRSASTWKGFGKTSATPARRSSRASRRCRRR